MPSQSDTVASARYRVRRVAPLRAALYGAGVGLALSLPGITMAALMVGVNFVIGNLAQLDESAFAVFALGGNVVFVASLGFVGGGGAALFYNWLSPRFGQATITVKRIAL